MLENEADEGGFEMELPPNRFRTRSVAIVAGYSPERLYSNMPPGAFVVESGVYKVGADREWERPEPIYWKQVVFGARSGSDGSGTMPRRVGRLAEEDIQRLRAMEQPQKTKNRFIQQSNLELRRTSASTAKLRASSPMDQEAPLVAFASPGSEISTVPHPTSAEKSLPSTLLTSRGLSSISSPNFTGTGGSSSRSRLLKSSTDMTTLNTPNLGTIQEQSYSDVNFPTGRTSSIVQADVHSQNQVGQPQQPHHQLPQQHQMTRRDRERLEQQLYWERHTYLNADSMFPNYALNYPAPIHHHPQYQGSISPSIQYPEVIPPRYYEETLGIGIPQPYHHRGIQQQPHGWPQYQQQQQQIPLATSSPPSSRSHSALQQPMPQQPPLPAGPGPGYYVDMNQGSQPPQPQSQSQAQGSLGLPFKTSTRTSLHDYENMRYYLGQGQPAVQPPPQPMQRTSVPTTESGSNPAVRRRPRPRPQGSDGSGSGPGRAHRESSIVDGELLLKPRPRSSRSDGGDAVSLVSEVLDAEVTALTNSSPGSSNGSTERKPSVSKRKLKAALNEAKRSLESSVSPPSQENSTSSGIASKNSSQNQTTSSSLSGSLGIPAGAPGDKAGLEPIPEGTRMYYYDDLPFYENWPPPKTSTASSHGSQYPPPVRPRLSTYLGYQFVPPPEAAVGGQLLPPLIPHQSLGQAALPQHPARVMNMDRKFADSPAGDLDTSLDTPPSNAQGSRPGSAHSAPLLDLSIDRHYEFDTGLSRTPTDDINLHSNQPMLLLPHNWNRPYLGYNPRRDRELGPAAMAAGRERVFSDSEIYSPVFPRGRPEPRIDISARVQAMKKEFAEYRSQQLQEQEQKRQQEQHGGSTPPSRSSGGGCQSSPDLLASKSKKPAESSDQTTTSGRLSSASAQLKDAADRLESLI